MRVRKGRKRDGESKRAKHGSSPATTQKKDARHAVRILLLFIERYTQTKRALVLQLWKAPLDDVIDIKY